MSANPIITSPIGKPNRLTNNQYIYAFAYDQATGRTFVSGNFSSVTGLYAPVNTGAVSRNYIAAFEANGSVSAWYPSVDSLAVEMVVDGSTLYIGGYFGSVNGSIRRGFAALDTTTGALLSLDPQLEKYDDYSLGGTYSAAEVFHITVDTPNNRIHLSGDIDRSPAIASLNGNVIINKTTGAAVGNLNAYYNDSEIYPGGYGKAVLSSGKIYYVGYMDSLDYNSNTYTLGGFLSYNAATGVPNLSLLPLFSNSQTFPSFYSPSSLTVLNGIIYFVGGFDTVNGTTRAGGAAIDATSGALYSWNPTINGTAYYIDTDGTYFYISGYIASVNGVSTPHFAAVDTSGNLVSTKKLYPSFPVTPHYPAGLQLVPNGVMRVISNISKVWDTRYQSPRN